MSMTSVCPSVTLVDYDYDQIVRQKVEIGACQYRSVSRLYVRAEADPGREYEKYVELCSIV